MQPINWMKSNRNVIVAGISSVLLPGLGHVYSGKRKTGVILFLVYAAALSVLHFTSAPKTYWGLLGSLWAISILASVVSVNCLVQLKRANKGSFSKWFIAVFALLAWVAGLYTCQLVAIASGIRTFTVPSSSMDPTIAPNEIIVGDMNYYKTHSPKRGELAIYQSSYGPLNMVKRIVATGGDSIEIRNAVVFVNGIQVEEPFIKYRFDEDFRGVNWINDYGPTTIPKDFVFVMGDNRPLSLDSRSPDIGPIPLRQLNGRALYIVRSNESSRQGKSFN